MRAQGLWLGLVLAASASGLASAQTPDLCGGMPLQARIAEAVDGASLRLADGRVVRLASVVAPLGLDGDREAPVRARQALSALATGKDAILYVAAETDRYGRLSAYAVSLEDKRWLEREMLAQGLARVYFVTDDKCAKALLQVEQAARASRAGIWSEERFQVFEADALEALLSAAGRFVVVEGVVRRVGQSRGRLYLDFGRRFTEDFTIIVPDRIQKALAAQGSHPKGWRGKRVRVRGVLFSWGGPAIELRMAQAIELLDAIP